MVIECIKKWACSMVLLINHEGDAHRDCVKDAAYAAIAQVHYFGDANNSPYLCHDVYEDLEHYGQII
jgi:hypothetical protein